MHDLVITVSDGREFRFTSQYSPEEILSREYVMVDRVYISKYQIVTIEQL